MNPTFVIAAGLYLHALFAPMSIAGTQIGLGIAALGLLFAFARGWRPGRTPLDLPALAFVLACVLSDLWSPFGAPDLSFATLWRPIVGFFVVAHGLSLLPPGASTRLLGWLAVGLGLSAVVGLVQYRTGVDLVYAVHLRATPASVEAPGVPDRFGAMGFFTSRLTFGHNATVVIAVLAGALRPRFAVSAVVVGLAAVLVTFDRAAYLGLAAAAVVLIAMSAPALRGWLAAFALVLLVAGAAHPGVRGRFRSSFDPARNADRVFIWERAKEIVRDHPLRGIGFGNYPRVCPIYYDRVDPSFPMRTWAHNTFLSLYAETGPLGFAAFVWLLVAAAAALARRPPYAASAAAAGCALLVIAQFHDVLYDTKVMYPLWLAMGLALRPRQSSAAGNAAGSPGRARP